MTDHQDSETQLSDKIEQAARADWVRLDREILALEQRRDRLAMDMQLACQHTDVLVSGRGAGERRVCVKCGFYEEGWTFELLGPYGRPVRRVDHEEIVRYQVGPHFGGRLVGEFGPGNHAALLADLRQRWEKSIQDREQYRAKHWGER